MANAHSPEPVCPVCGAKFRDGKRLERTSEQSGTARQTCTDLKTSTQGALCRRTTKTASRGLNKEAGHVAIVGHFHPGGCAVRDGSCRDPVVNQ
ncbi:hypothetical protein [Aurantimonas coralicida]|uniref:hypothetical protein n=1 Tax=Aurantimonas coralicida TaxID=182270 RepID=UPI001E43D9E2|nr:hypothetical protein [Aurantimonas coralicida]MCD1644184.1 hypothetical protein [Aurantimonas coralicida]